MRSGGSWTVGRRKTALFSLPLPSAPQRARKRPEQRTDSCPAGSEAKANRGQRRPQRAAEEGRATKDTSPGATRAAARPRSPGPRQKTKPRARRRRKERSDEPRRKGSKRSAATAESDWAGAEHPDGKGARQAGARPGARATGKAQRKDRARAGSEAEAKGAPGGKAAAAAAPQRTAAGHRGRQSNGKARRPRKHRTVPEAPTGAPAGQAPRTGAEAQADERAGGAAGKAGRKRAAAPDRRSPGAPEARDGAPPQRRNEAHADGNTSSAAAAAQPPRGAPRPQGRANDETARARAGTKLRRPDRREGAPTKPPCPPLELPRGGQAKRSPEGGRGAARSATRGEGGRRPENNAAGAGLQPFADHRGSSYFMFDTET